MAPESAPKRRHVWYQKRAPKSAPKGVLKNQIQSAKTRFLRGARDECRRHGFWTSRTPWSALFGRDPKSTFGNVFGIFLGTLFDALMGALFGELFGVLVGAPIAKISQQPASNKPHAAEQNQHSAEHLELTARNNAFKQKATLFFLGVHGSLLATDRSNVIALPISRILFGKTPDFWVTKVEGARKGCNFFGGTVQACMCDWSQNLSKRRIWLAHPSCAGLRSLHVLAAGPRASTCEKCGTHANP